MAQNTIDAYHGTTAAAAQAIRHEKCFHASVNDNEWLGHGVYFFRYRLHAESWIRKRRLNPGEVLTVRLEYDDREMLDLDDPAQLNALNREMKHLEEMIGDSIRLGTLRGDELHKRWCLGCNLYRYLHEEIGIISYTFPQSKIGAAQFRGNERQLCVSRQELITGIT